MGDLSKIPKEITRKIAVEHLEHQEDFESFKKVCSAWRFETRDVKFISPSKNIQPPWLMLADSPANPHCRFYSLYNLMTRKIELPEFDDDDNRRYFSSKGWLISITMKQNLIHLFDVFNSRLITPPPVPFPAFLPDNHWDHLSYIYEVHKFVLSSDYRVPPSDDFQVAIVFGTRRIIAFWKPGLQQWNKAAFDVVQIYEYDACFFKGQFYSINHFGHITCYGPHNNTPRTVSDLQAQGVVAFNPHKYYIIGFHTALLVIHRKVFTNGCDEYYTTSFQLFEVNVDDNGKAKQVEGIGDGALFVGYNSTFFVEASQHGCRRNCIYFTDDNVEQYNINQQSPQSGGGRDMGIFSLEENKVISQVYNGPSQFHDVTPPMWVQLPHRNPEMTTQK